MLRVERSTIVKKTIKDCAAFLAEPMNFANIDRKVRNLKILERAPNYSLIHISGLFAGFFPYTMQLRLDRQADGGLLIYKIAGPIKAFDASFTLKETPEGTMITHVEAFDFFELIPGLSSRLFKSFVSRVVEEELYRLRRLIEEGWETQIPWD